MNNFDLHEEAQQLADTKTAYELARELVELLNEMTVTKDRLLKANKEISRLSLENTFELHKIKAEAVREAVWKCKVKVLDGPDVFSDCLLDYADQLERGEA